MDFNNYRTDSYSNLAFDRYIYHNGQNIYNPKPQAPGQSQATDDSFSLEEILEQDSNKLLDKVVTTALCISYRLKLYRSTSYQLEQKWNEFSEQIGGLSSFMLGYNQNIERRKSMLEKERTTIEKMMLENKHQTWKDLNEPISYFVDEWHKRQELKQDRKILD
ncbi:MAG: hypothetical protein DRN14_02715 [Thermoplasmata archaeon]|nr:MAG: hypothetical protein DRN14_02715 [Thermoplasmata archaeon]